MKKAILATKVGMTQIFNEDGVLIPVTVLQAGPCVVTQIKTVENDGYEAVQVGFVDKKEKVINRDKAGKKEVVTILRAVHKYKDSREQFERRTHKRLIDIIAPTPKTVDALQRLEMPAGVYIDIKMKTNK